MNNQLNNLKLLQYFNAVCDLIEAGSRRVVCRELLRLSISLLDTVVYRFFGVSLTKTDRNLIVVETFDNNLQKSGKYYNKRERERMRHQTLFENLETFPKSKKILEKLEIFYTVFFCHIRSFTFFVRIACLKRVLSL